MLRLFLVVFIVLLVANIFLKGIPLTKRIWAVFCCILWIEVISYLIKAMD